MNDILGSTLVKQLVDIMIREGVDEVTILYETKVSSRLSWRQKSQMRWPLDCMESWVLLEKSDWRIIISMDLTPFV
jgi:hypothetical protein